MSDEVSSGCETKAIVAGTGNFFHTAAAGLVGQGATKQ